MERYTRSLLKKKSDKCDNVNRFNAVVVKGFIKYLQKLSN